MPFDHTIQAMICPSPPPRPFPSLLNTDDDKEPLSVTRPRTRAHEKTQTCRIPSHPIPCYPHHAQTPQNHNLINSSLTASGVMMPVSVNRAEIRSGGVSSTMSSTPDKGSWIWLWLEEPEPEPVVLKRKTSCLTPMRASSAWPPPSGKLRTNLYDSATT